jgi:DNA-binding NarL/FixJ family response regulator
MGLRCVIVEDQVMFLQLLTKSLGSHRGLDIVATATSAADGMLLCRKHRPDLLILDLCLPDAPGATVAEDLLSHSPDTLVIILSAEASGFNCPKDLRGIIHAVVDKTSAYDELNAEINYLLAGEPMSSGKLKSQLTVREQQVFELIGKGYSNNQISGMLGLSPHTVKEHRKHIVHKLGVGGLGLVRLAALEREVMDLTWE